MLIKPDLEVWLVSDPLLSSQWRGLASQLSLTSSIPRVEVRLRTDSEKVAEVLRLWRTEAPHSYTVQRLLSVLDRMGMKSLYEWVELMTKERLDLERMELYVSRCNSPRVCDLSRFSCSPSHSRPLSVLTEDLNSSLSHSSCSPPVRERGGGGGVFNTLYRPQYLPRTRGGSRGQGGVRGSHRHSSYITPTITIHTGTPISSPSDTRPQSSLLDNFDKAFADYKKKENKKILKTNIETDRYFDNLAALLREL